ncbi:hypothetical protein [Arthrobacter sp. NPDC056493]|uniref:hypothetical protein n=1 Tax=Arthrobacter sp. NPDC056493 TaxID=3345839 RepID=UPI00366F3691
MTNTDLMTERPQLTMWASSLAEIEALLESGERHLQMMARTYGDRGILVTKHSPGHLTLRLDPAVPYGMTYERTAHG